MRSLLWICAACIPLAAQSTAAPDWQTAAGGKMEFDVASVKHDLSHRYRYSAFPFDATNNFAPGGSFSATLPVWEIIAFAYKLTISEARSSQAHLPAWANDYNEMYAIDAKVAGNPTKDQMRLMLQSLLADRFQLAAHFETREVPVLVLTLVKPGHPGPQLRLHSEGRPCNVDDVTQCDTPQIKLGATEVLSSRNMTLARIADMIAMPHFLDQPVIDRTGLAGSFDFYVSYAAESPDGLASDLLAVPFRTALQQQLGLKLAPSRAPVRGLVIDRLERPSAN
jgi:uncharacterized protein (TIGR03435 family)